MSSNYSYFSFKSDNRPELNCYIYSASRVDVNGRKRAETKYQIESDSIKDVRRRSLLAKCPFCGGAISITENHFDTGAGSVSLTTRICSTCGYWTTDRCEGWTVDTSASGYFTELREPILFTFGRIQQDDPLFEILHYVKSNKLGVLDMNPNRFEQLVGAILNECFCCDVTHVGRTNDGGTDLFFIQNDEKVLVQVKRRSKQNSCESVRVVRELIGTMTIEQSRKGILVTTADHFSDNSMAVKKRLYSEQNIEIDLIDRSRLFHLLDSVPSYAIPNLIDL